MMKPDKFFERIEHHLQFETSQLARRVENSGFQYSDVVLNFGKYSGSELSEIPLKYLDETISVMPETWLVRKVKCFVDSCMCNWLSSGCGSYAGTVPNKKWNDLIPIINEERQDPKGDFLDYAHPY